MSEARGRDSRQEELRTERRRRDDATIDGGQALKLAVPLDIQAKLTEQGREWRWANDDGNRIHRLTVLDDWDKVEGVTPVEVVVDRAKGLTAKAYLLSKPKEFIAEDRHKRDAARMSTEQAMVEGKVPNAGDQPASRPDNVYVPPGNKIERGNQII
jgi:hypothetical protein